MNYNDNWYNTTKWLDVRDFFKLNPDYNKLMIIGDNGIGKSYSAEEMAVDYVQEGKHVVWTRNTGEESKKMINAIKLRFAVRGLDNDYIFKKEGIYTKALDGKKWVVGEQVMAFMYLSSITTSLPDEFKARLIVIDEFIDGNEKRVFVMKEYAKQLQKAVSRLIRPLEENEVCKMIMLANPHQPEHDLIYAFGIDFDWDKLSKGLIDTQLKDDLCAIVFPKQFDIPEMESAINYMRFDKTTKSNYSFINNSYKRIEPITKNFICNFTITTFNGDILAYGWDNNKYRIEIANISKFNDVPHFVFDEEELIQGYNTKGLVLDKEQQSRILQEYNQNILLDNVYYDSVWTKKMSSGFSMIMTFNYYSH